MHAVYGKAFHQRARTVIDELRKAQKELMQLRGKLEDRLSVALAPASANTPMWSCAPLKASGLR